MVDDTPVDNEIYDNFISLEIYRLELSKIDIREYVHIDEFCVCVFVSLLEIGKKSILCLKYLSSKPFFLRSQ